MTSPEETLRALKREWLAEFADELTTRYTYRSDCPGCRDLAASRDRLREILRRMKEGA